MKRAMLGSLLIHLAVLALFVRGGGGAAGNCEGPNCTDIPAQGPTKENDGKGNTTEEEARTKIEAKPLEVMKVSPEVLKQIEKQDSQMKLEEERKRQQAKAEQEARECPMWFGGIGVTFSSLDGVVLEAHPGYPAHEAGIRAGDRLYSDGPIKGEIGTIVTVTVERGGETFKVALIREKICVVKEETP